MKKKPFPSYLHHHHAPEAIVQRLKQKKKVSYLRDFIYGAIDGTVTTFAVVSGANGANLEIKTVLILGFANLIADGFSMAASNYLGTKAESDEFILLEHFEKNEINQFPEGEKEEVRQILMSKGFKGSLLEEAVTVIVSNPKQWISLMLNEEYGVNGKKKSALRAGFITFISFFIFGLIPLFPFLFKTQHSFMIASILTSIAFFSVGSLKSLWTIDSLWFSGLKTLILGAIASLLAYGAGVFLS